MSMRYEELTTPEAVLAAFEAGRHVEYTAFKKDDIDMPASNRPNSGGWVTAIQLSVEEIVYELRVGRYRALIEDAPQEFEDDAADCEAEELTRRALGDGKINPDATSVSDLFIGDDDEDAPPIPEGFTPWHGGECPVSGDTKVTPFFRDGSSSAPNHADNLQWDHYGEEIDIIAYRVESAQPKPGPAPSDVEALALSVGADRSPAEPEAGIVSVYWEFSDAQLHEFARRLRPQVDEATELTDAQCLAIYQAVSRANLMRDVKTPARMQGIVRGAALTAALNPEADNG